MSAAALSHHSKKVQALVRRLKTPAAVQAWIYSLRYNPANTMRTLGGVIDFNTAHCLEAALAAAAILEHHNYPPLILDLESTDLLDHTLFLFQWRGKYGAVAMSHDIGLYGRRPVFNNLQALVQSYAIPYIDEHAAIKAFGVLDLRTMKNPAWRTSPRNVWYIEEALRKIPHQKFSLPAAATKNWRRRYTAYKRDYPGQQPAYYPNQRFWM